MFKNKQMNWKMSGYGQVGFSFEQSLFANWLLQNWLPTNSFYVLSSNFFQFFKVDSANCKAWRMMLPRRSKTLFEQIASQLQPLKNWLWLMNDRASLDACLETGAQATNSQTKSLKLVEDAQDDEFRSRKRLCWFKSRRRVWNFQMRRRL